MNKKTRFMRKKISVAIFSALGFFCFFQAFAKVEVGNQFPEAYTQYIKKLPSSGPESSNKDPRVEEILPYYLHPLSKFTLNIREESSSTYSKGEKISLIGSVKFNFEGNENISRVLQECLSKVPDKGACVPPKVYNITQVNDLGIFVQVWGKDSDKIQSQKGDYLVDEFYVNPSMALKSGDTKPFKINWSVPQGISEGDYYFSLYVNGNKSFDLWGSPLVSFNAAKTIGFQIKGSKNNDETGLGIMIDKNNIKIGNQAYSYRIPAPVIPNANTSIKTTILNLDPNQANAKVKYELFRWGQEDPTDLIEKKESSVTINPKGQTEIAYDFKPNNTDSVYNLKITVTTGNSQSIANIRFLVKGSNRGIFRYLGVVRSLGERGGYLPAICFTDAQWEGSFDGKMKVNVASGANEEPIDSWEGEIQSNANKEKCVVIKTTKPITDDDGCLKLRGEIWNNQNNIVDKKEILFNCSEDILNGNGTQNAIHKISGGIIEQLGNNNNILVVLFSILIILIIVFSIIYKRNQNGQK